MDHENTGFLDWLAHLSEKEVSFGPTVVALNGYYTTATSSWQGLVPMGS